MNDSDSATVAYIESLTTDNPISCGALLIRAREAAGLTQKQLAEQLHLLPAVVRALEADDFAAIRSPLYCRGYLTGYAKHMKLDVSEILGLYERQCPKPIVENNAVIKPPMHTTFKPVAIPFSAVARRGGYGKSIAALVAVVVIVSVLFVVNNTSMNSKMESSFTPSSVSASASQVRTEQLPASKQAKMSDDVTGAAVTSKTVALPSNNPLQIEDSRGKVMASIDAPLKLEAPIVSQPNQSADGSDTLSLRFTDKCWIEIRDRNNVVIASGMYRANDALNVSGKGPFKLHLGFAPGVNVALNGRAIDVGDGDAVNHTARLVVGSS